MSQTVKKEKVYRVSEQLSPLLWLDHGDVSESEFNELMETNPGKLFRIDYEVTESMRAYKDAFWQGD